MATAQKYGHLMQGQKAGLLQRTLVIQVLHKMLD